MGNLANFVEMLAGEPGLRATLIMFVGAGAANPTKKFGNGVTVTWVSTGLYQVVWGENPGLYCGFLEALQATAPAGVKGYTVVAGDFNQTTFTQQFSVYNSAFALADLAAAQTLILAVLHKATSVS